ncbi:MAG: hypothetical protein EOQ48_21975 [Mesorhizobium sp.]|nr:MAG: hypothetical protein EOQ48_21975 [Mesorhizobium sp.]
MAYLIGRTRTKIHTDDTRLPILAPGTGMTHKGALWVYVADDRNSGSQEPPIAWYRATMGRAGESVMTELAGFASLARIHNRINETLFDRPHDYAPRFTTKLSGGIDPRPWCQGFYAAMNLNIKRWKRLLDLKNPNHGLLLPILIYCVDKKGRPVLGKPRPGPETAHFIEHEAYKDIALVVPALRELHYVTHYDDPR